MAGPARIKLIGIVKGHYNEGAEIGLGQRNDAVVPLAKVNSGILAVIPAYLLHDILFCEALEKQRAAVK